MDIVNIIDAPLVGSRKFSERVDIMPVSNRKPRAKPRIPKVAKCYTCVVCGRESKESEFYMNKYSPLWVHSDSRVPICKDCLAERLEQLTEKYKSGALAMHMCMYIIDSPFYPDVYEKLQEREGSAGVLLGTYLRQLQLGQYRNRNYCNTIMDKVTIQLEEMAKNESEPELEERTVRWTKEDRQNRDFAISVVGYNPFEDIGLDDFDKKTLFNTLAGYCDNDSVRRDNHKIQCILQLIQAQLQVTKIDRIINEMLRNPELDEKLIQKLTSTKKQLLDSIANIAKDNNIASNYNDNSKVGKDTLGQKMKDMAKDGYEQIKVNLFDVKTSAAMKQIADLSNQSIIEQLTLDTNDYSDMVKEQRILIQSLEAERDSLAEENRNFKNQAELLAYGKGGR